jgi:hypothetical protein
VAQKNFGRTASGSTLQFQAQAKGFYAFVVRSANTPAAVKDTPYTLRVSYSAPQTL